MPYIMSQILSLRMLLFFLPRDCEQSLMTLLFFRSSLVTTTLYCWHYSNKIQILFPRAKFMFGCDEKRTKKKSYIVKLFHQSRGKGNNTMGKNAVWITG